MSLFYSSNHNLCPKFQPLPSRINTSYGIIPKTNKKWPQPTKLLKLFSQCVSLYLTRLFELRKSCWEICDSQSVWKSQFSDGFARNSLVLAKQPVVCDETTRCSCDFKGHFSKNFPRNLFFFPWNFENVRWNFENVRRNWRKMPKVWNERAEKTKRKRKKCVLIF